MNNVELAQRRALLESKAQRVAGLHPMVAAGEIKAAALLAAEITSELAHREIERGQHGE
jgi:hypothetical protein